MQSSPDVDRFPRCAAGTTVVAACEGLVDDLRARWELPSVYLLVDGRLRCQAARGYFQVVDGFTPATGVLGRVVTSGTMEVLDDVAEDPTFIAAIPGIRAEACAPVRVHGQVVGAVNVESMTALGPDAKVGLSVAVATLGARIEALGGLPEVPLAQRLARIAVGLASLTDAAAIQDRVVEGAVAVSGMSSAALCRRADDGGWSVCRSIGPLGPALRAWTDAEYGVVAGWVGAGTSSHFRGQPGTVPPGYDFLLQAGVRAVMVHPLVVADRVTGLLVSAHTEPTPHDATVGAAVELLAAQAAAALGMADAIAELNLRARQDPLTGLGHATAFAEDLEDAVRATARASGEPTACLLIDLDNFKAVNDTYGHLAGDRLLRTLVRELTSVLRTEDTMYRIGGDEFAVLARASPHEAGEIGRRLVRAARRVRTTVSIGLAMMAADASAEHTRLRADRALYQAKTLGRDRVATASA